jgi:hypothetical protein
MIPDLLEDPADLLGIGQAFLDSLQDRVLGQPPADEELGVAGSLRRSVAAGLPAAFPAHLRDGSAAGAAGHSTREQDSALVACRWRSA